MSTTHRLSVLCRTGLSPYRRCLAAHTTGSAISLNPTASTSPHQISSTLRCTCRRYDPSHGCLPSCTMFATRSYLVTPMSVWEGVEQVHTCMAERVKHGESCLPSDAEMRS